jgi:hypothetical protein
MVLDGELAVEYTINLASADRELAEGHYRASVVYTFTISNGLASTRGHVVLTDGSVEVIEQGGKDPPTAARIALEGSSGKDGNRLRPRFFSGFLTDTLNTSLRTETTTPFPR